MVDLVKIRKKAKRESGVGSGESEQTAAERNRHPRDAAARAAATESDSDTRHPTPDTRVTQTRPIQSRPPASAAKASSKQRSRDRARRSGRAAHVHHRRRAVRGVDRAHRRDRHAARRPRSVPNADPTIVGIISLRGTIVTVIDVRRKLRHPPRARRQRHAHHRRRARRRDPRLRSRSRSARRSKSTPRAIEPHPVVHSSELSEAVRGVFRHANALTILLDLDKLLA